MSMTKYPQLLLEKSEEHYDWFVVSADCKWRNLVIQRGFTTDFASVPQMFWVIIPPHGRAARASILHDWLYQKQYTHHFNRAEVDRIWLSLMIEDNVPIWQALLMYMFVRWFGQKVWMKYDKDR